MSHTNTTTSQLITNKTAIERLRNFSAIVQLVAKEHSFPIGDDLKRHRTI